MKRLSLIFVLVLAACAPSAKAVQTAIAGTQAGWTPVPTQTAWKIIQTEIVVQTQVVAPTLPPTPQNTPEPTVSALLKPRGSGVYLINIDIAPGIWRSDGKADDCYWKLSDRTGETVDNYYGYGGGTAYLPPDGFQILFEDCGTWTFLQAP